MGIGGLAPMRRRRMRTRLRLKQVYIFDASILRFFEEGKRSPVVVVMVMVMMMVMAKQQWSGRWVGYYYY